MVSPVGLTAKRTNRKFIRLAVAMTPMLSRDDIPVGFFGLIDGLAAHMSGYREEIQ